MADHEQVGRLAAEHFLDRGHRHFGFFGYTNHAFSKGRELGLPRPNFAIWLETVEVESSESRLRSVAVKRAASPSSFSTFAGGTAWNLEALHNCPALAVEERRHVLGGTANLLQASGPSIQGTVRIYGRTR